MSNFYAHRSLKRQEDNQVKQLFALLGYVNVKAARIYVDEIDLGLQCSDDSDDSDSDQYQV